MTDGIETTALEGMIRQIIKEKLSQIPIEGGLNSTGETVRAVELPHVHVSETDRLKTGNPGDVVYTKDIFTLKESPRLGAGIMEMRETTFLWTLNYDEIDYVIDGTLRVVLNGKTVTANAGELILIPKGSSISFSVPNFARFLYVTYPADWANQQ